MRGTMPVLTTLMAGVIGVAAGVWPTVRAQAASDEPTMRDQLAGVLEDQSWAKPKDGSWTPPKASPDGLPPVLRKIVTQDKVVFLTIDDGYEYDPEFVKLVRQHRVPIMTFLTTSYVRGQGQYFWALRNAGSRMENHTVSHKNMALLSQEMQKEEICKASDTIAQQYGSRPQIFRPPFGSLSADGKTTREVAKQCGIKSILLWSAEFYNGTTSPGGVKDAFVRGDGGTGFRPGDIVLMHYRKGLAQQFQTILTWMKQQGYRPAAVENYLPRSLGGNAPDAEPAGTVPVRGD